MSTHRKSRPIMTELFFNSLPDLAVITSYMGQYVACNQAMTAALGYSEEELHSYNYSDLAPHLNRKRCSSQVLQSCMGRLASVVITHDRCGTRMAASSWLIGRFGPIQRITLSMPLAAYKVPNRRRRNQR